MPADPDGPNAIYFISLILLAVIGALYAAGESFLIHINENKLRKSAEAGNRGARLLLKTLDSRNENFSSMQLGMMLFSALTTVYSVKLFSPYMSQWYHTLSGSAAVKLGTLSAAVLSLIVFFTCCDFIPKKLVAHRADRAAYGSAGLIRVLHCLMVPFLGLFNLLSNIFLRIFGFDPKNLTETVTEEEEIMMLVGESEEKGVIEETEKDMIENILDFNDTTVSEVMTHRTEISALPDTASMEEIITVSVEEGFSRIPVYHEDIDSIIGILYVKDLIPYVGKSLPDFISILDIVRPAYFIPESKKCSQLFNELTAKKIQIAVIVDEYGGTSGLITLEDLVESILGNIQDEYDNEEEDITKVSEYEFTVDGGTSIYEVSDLTDTELPEGDYDTIAGFVTERLGRILKEGEHPTIQAMGLTITVTEVEDQRISKLLIKKDVPENILEQ